MSQHSRPSQQQTDAFNQLPAGRPLLVQMHWRWTDKGAQPPAMVAFFSACQNAGAQIVSQARVDLLAIGADERQWSEICLLEFPAPQALATTINSPATQALMAQASEVEVLVATLPHLRIQRMIRILNQWMPWLPRPRAGSEMPLAELQGGINPTEAQMQAFTAAEQNRPVHMFNLLRFHGRAQYPDGDRDRSGRTAYEQGYGRVAMSCFLRLGGRMVALGRYRMTLVGGDGDPAPDAWDEIAVIQYPHRAAFVHMVSNPAYIRALEHRHAGLAETQVWSTAPRAEYV